MNKYKLVNGWTKETVMAQIKKYNNGRRAERIPNPSWPDIVVCAYQASNGNRCAVGCFIPDDHKALSGFNGATELVRKYRDLAKLMPFEGRALEAFQESHDSFIKNFSNPSVHKVIEAFLNNYVE